MAVTMTVAELLAALRLGDSTEETAEVTRLLAYCVEAIAQHAPSASETASNESARRLAGYLFDMPEAARSDGYSNAMRNSGAARMLLPYRVHRLGIADQVEAAQAAVGTADNPVTGLDIVGGELVVTFQDGTTDVLDLPADQVARDAAGVAQAAADANAVTAATHAADANAHPTPPTVLYEAATAALQTSTGLITGNVVCPETGYLEFYFEGLSGSRKGGIAYARIPAARVRGAMSALAVAYGNDNEDVLVIPHGANRGIGIAVQATTNYMMLNAQAAGNYNIRIAHIG